MAEKKKYTVRTASAQIVTSDERVHILYAGNPLPEGVTNLKFLIDGGFVADSNPDEVVPVLGSSPPELAAHQTVPSNPTLPQGRKRS